MNNLTCFSLHAVHTQSNGDAQRIPGLKKDDSCSCQVNSSVWAFPARKFEGVLQLVQDCGDNLQSLQAQVRRVTVGYDYVLKCFPVPQTT